MKTIYTTVFALLLLTSTPTYALSTVATESTINITNITSTSATVNIVPPALAKITAEDRGKLYFEYSETQQVCIMIYPTPANCLPKKTPVGQTSVTLTDLTPHTQYTISFKRDNTINCVTTPCPGNEFQSDKATFTTLPANTPVNSTITTNLRFRSRGPNVVILQDTLRARGYFDTASTGYFGIATLKAVKDFQKNSMHISPTGFVGSLTRAALTTTTSSDTHFEGTIQAVSTACFADGECSVTIDGKKVVTTIGWSQDIVGSIKGTVTSIGDIETSKIGAKAKVYAKKTEDGYTLYGNSAYYIEVR